MISGSRDSTQPQTTSRYEVLVRQGAALEWVTCSSFVPPSPLCYSARANSPSLPIQLLPRPALTWLRRTANHGAIDARVFESGNNSLILGRLLCD